MTYEEAIMKMAELTELEDKLRRYGMMIKCFDDLKRHANTVLEYNRTAMLLADTVDRGNKVAARMEVLLAELKDFTKEIEGS